jgi:fission process protein 1
MAHHAETDPLRHGPLRYSAFTSDVGEAFKHFISRRLYLGSYAVVAAYSLLDTADKGRRAYARTHQARAAAPSPVFAAAGSGLPALPRTLPDLPLASAAASATVASATASATAFARTTAGVAAACAACLPPPAAYGGAAASSIAEQHSTAVPVAAAILDATLFHATASLGIPALAINRTVWATRHLLSRPSLARLPASLRAAAPSAAGLALIPLAVPHIDAAVERLLDSHLRPHLPKEAHAE